MVATIKQWFILIGILAGLMFGPGNIEGKLFPVLSPMEVSEASTSTEGSFGVKFYGKAERLRDSCTLEEIRWYIGIRGRESARAEGKISPIQIRRKGDFTFGPWYIYDVHPALFNGYTYANSYHQCRTFGINHFWITRTQFWN